MKKLRLLTIMICLCLTVNCVIIPCNTLAEETFAEEVPSLQEDPDVTVDVQGEKQEESESVTDEEVTDSADVTDNETITVPSTTETPAPEEAEEVPVITETPEVTPESTEEEIPEAVLEKGTEGYAYIAVDQVLMYTECSISGESAEISGNRIVIVLDKQDEMVKVQTVDGESLVTGWVLAEALRDITEEEIEAATELKSKIEEILNTEEEVEPSISISIASNTMGVGEMLKLTVAKVGMAEDTPIRMAYNSKYIRVYGIADDPSSVYVKAIKTIKSTGLTIVCGDQKQTISIRIVKAPSSIKLFSNRYNLIVGESTFTAVSYSKGSYSTITYTSSDDSIATVDEKGNITATGYGVATITANTFKSNVKARVNITVYREPASIAFRQSEYLIAKGKSTNSAIDAADVFGDPSIISGAVFSSSDTSVFTVDEKTGRITGVESGTAELIAEVNGLQASATVKVVNIQATTGTIRIGQGNLINILDYGYLIPDGFDDIHEVTFALRTSNKKKVAVNNSGLIKGSKTGSATVTVYTNIGLTFKFKVNVVKYPSNIGLYSRGSSAGTVTLGVGMEQDLSAAFNKGAYTALTFESTDESIVKIEQTSATSVNMSAVGVGEADVIVRAISGKFANSPRVSHIIVKDAPEYIDFAKSVYHIGAGDSTSTSVVIPDDTCTRITYGLNDTNGISVDSNGNIKTNGNAAGKTYELTAYSHVDGVKATTVINVAPAPTRVEFVDGSAIAVGKGSFLQLPDVIVYSGEDVLEDSPVYYATSNKKIVIVGSGGLIKGVNTGSAYITVRTSNNQRATIKVYVVNGAVNNVVLNKTEKTFYIRESEGLYGDGMQLSQTVIIGGKNTYAPVVWTSSDTSVAKVSATGYVTPTGIGTCVIKATHFSGLSAECEVKVVNASRTLYFDNSTATGVGKSERLIPVFEDNESSSELVFASSDDSVISVNTEGVYTAIGCGTATISASGSFDLTADIVMTVLDAPTAVSFAGNNVYLKAGESLDLKATFTPSEEVFTEYSCVSEDTNIVSVDGTVITAITSGHSTITLTTYNGITAHCDVDVVNSDESTDSFICDQIGIIPNQNVSISELIRSGKGIYENGYSLATDAESVSIDGSCVTLKSETESAVIELVCNGSVCDSLTLIPVLDYEPEIYVDEVLYTTDDTITMAANGIAGSDPQSHEIRVEVKSDAITAIGGCLGIMDAEIDIADSRLASFEWTSTATQLKGTLNAGIISGDTTMVVTVCGKEYNYPVRVNGRRYRALLVGEFTTESCGSRYLPFASGNVNGFAKILKAYYDEVRVYGSNPKAAEIQSYIQNYAKDSTANDVTLVYICAHGHTSSGNYSFSTPYNEAIPAKNLTAELAKIKGQVVLVLDSCYSGYYLTNQKTAIQSAGNISVITAASGYAASWYKSGSTSFEFFTSVVMTGLGGSNNLSMIAPHMNALNADRDTNGIVTINELFVYAKENTKNICNNYYQANKNTFCFYIGNTNSPAGFASLKNWTQIPVYYIAPSANNLPILPISF